MWHVLCFADSDSEGMGYQDPPHQAQDADQPGVNGGAAAAAGKPS